MSEVVAARVEDALRRYVVANYAAGAEVASDDDLLATGVLDSMGVMETIGFIEHELGVSIEDEEIVPENFRSLRSMSELIAAKQAQGIAAPPAAEA